MVNGVSTRAKKKPVKEEIPRQEAIFLIYLFFECLLAFCHNWWNELVVVNRCTVTPLHFGIEKTDAVNMLFIHICVVSLRVCACLSVCARDSIWIWTILGGGGIAIKKKLWTLNNREHIFAHASGLPTVQTFRSFDTSSSSFDHHRLLVS